MQAKKGATLIAVAVKRLRPVSFDVSAIPETSKCQKESKGATSAD